MIITKRTGSLVRVSAEAPPGKIWVAGGIHELVAEARGGREATTEAQRDIRNRMKLGTETCEDKECDWCNEND